MISTLKITITQDFLLQIKLINSEDKEIVIKLPENQQEYYSPSIEFNQNSIITCQNDEKSIHFMKEWIQNSKNSTKYTIQFQEREYKLLPEVLFAIIISEFKKNIEKHYIIEETIVEIPSENHCISERIKTSLESISLQNVVVNPVPVDYSDQADYLQEILEMKETIEKQKRMIERAKEINPEAHEKLHEIFCNQKILSTEEEFNNELVKKFSTKERKTMKLTQLDNYCLFIASRYLETLEDHKNFTKVTRKLKYNMEKFHYNPISVDDSSIELFPNVESLHVYRLNDKYLERGRICRYVDWNIFSYNDMQEWKEENEEKDIEFKKVIWTKDDSYDHKKESRGIFIIPEGVKEINNDCFDLNRKIVKELTIPQSVTNLPYNMFLKLPYLTHLTISGNKYKLYKNRIFYTHHNYLLSIPLPSSIKLLNNQEVQPFTTFTIPSNVKYIFDYCFEDCDELTEIKGLENINEFGLGFGCFVNCPKLNRERYPQIEKNDKEYLNEVVKEKYQKQLEEWTSLKCSDILFDSDVDDWSEYTSVFDKKVYGKKQLTFIIEDEDGQIFGYYMNSTVKKYSVKLSTDNNSFEFNLQSHGRLPKPMKFEIKDLEKGGIVLNQQSYYFLISLGEIYLQKENHKNDSFCNQDESRFDYHGIENALCGKEYFKTKRILVIQMK